jgi:hypothetical protein
MYCIVKIKLNFSKSFSIKCRMVIYMKIIFLWKMFPWKRLKRTSSFDCYLKSLVWIFSFRFPVWFFFLFSFYFIIFTFTYMCMHYLCHLHPSTPPASRQNLFHPLLQLCWRENTRDNKKDISFLLVWDKDNYADS